MKKLIFLTALAIATASYTQRYTQPPDMNGPTWKSFSGFENTYAMDDFDTSWFAPTGTVTIRNFTWWGTRPSNDDRFGIVIYNDTGRGFPQVDGGSVHRQYANVHSIQRSPNLWEYWCNVDFSLFRRIASLASLPRELRESIDLTSSEDRLTLSPGRYWIEITREKPRSDNSNIFEWASGSSVVRGAPALQMTRRNALINSVTSVTQPLIRTDNNQPADLAFDLRFRYRNSSGDDY